MIVDLKLNKKTIIVVGGGAEAYRKVQSFLNCDAKIWVISREFSGEILGLEKENKIALLKTEVQDAETFVGSLSPKPDVFLAVTDDSKLNSELVKAAKQFRCIVYCVDNPALSDFILPAVARVGDVKVVVSTGGKSPAMARLLRQRIEKLITPQDLLEIQLQASMRSVLKKQVPNLKVRRRMLYEILNNNSIKQFLKQGRLQEAEKMAIKILQYKEA